MKKIVVIMIFSFLIISLLLPTKDLVSTVNDKISNDSEIVNKEEVIELIVEDNKLNMFQNNMFEENGRYWGELNRLKWMVYHKIDNYIYVNGEIHKINGTWDERENFLLDVAEVESLFSLNHIKENQFTVKEVDPSNICKNNLSSLEVLEILKDPNIPIEGAVITEVDTQLPGASRSYRGGFHEGFDWYSGAIGRDIDEETNVYPIYDGEVIRIDHNYVEMDSNYRENLLNVAVNEGMTSQDALDKLRGRQVWIQSENGVVVRYAHLSETNPHIKIGDSISEFDWLGKTGNSGTSNGVLGNDLDIHLHTDILVCGKNFWEYGITEDMVFGIIEIFKDNSENDWSTNQ